MLDKVGLLHFFAGRIFSGHEMPRSKPFPDVYLAAAAALGVPAQRCAVVEDTLVGLQAGVAAGAAVFAYVPQGRKTAALLAWHSAEKFGPPFPAWPHQLAISVGGC